MKKSHLLGGITHTRPRQSSAHTPKAEMCTRTKQDLPRGRKEGRRGKILKCHFKLNKVGLSKQMGEASCRVKGSSLKEASSLPQSSWSSLTLQPWLPAQLQHQILAGRTLPQPAAPAASIG